MLDLARTSFYVGLILVPYGLEQLCYWRYISRNPARPAHRPATVLGGYGLAYLWDAAHLAVLIAAGWRLIATTYPLTLWQGLGSALFLAGVALRIWALRELGPFYSASLLVTTTTGRQQRPHRRVRHPTWTPRRLVAGVRARLGWPSGGGLSIALTAGTAPKTGCCWPTRRRLPALLPGDVDPMDLVFWKRSGDV